MKFVDASNKPVLWYLENFSFFSVLSQEDRVKLGKVALMEPVSKEQTIYCSGQAATSFYLIKEGKVKIAQRVGDKKELILALLGPGEVFGELVFAGQEQREDMAIATEESLICKFEASDFHRLMNDNPRLTLQITKTIGNRLTKVQRRLESLIFKTAEERVREFLKELALGFGYAIAGDSNQYAIPIRLTHEEIGKLTANSRQTVTTVLKNLEKEELLTYNRHRIYVKQLDKL